MNENFRQAFVEKLKNISSERLVYVDESGIGQCIYREYARAPRGEKVIAKLVGENSNEPIFSPEFSLENGLLHLITEVLPTAFSLNFGLKTVYSSKPKKVLLLFLIAPLFFTSWF